MIMAPRYADDEMRSNTVREPILWPPGMQAIVRGYAGNDASLPDFCTRLLEESWDRNDVNRLSGTWESLRNSADLPADLKKFSNTSTHAIEAAQRELKINSR
jgi:hypothetical protein